MTTPLHLALWTKHKDLARASLNSPFVRGLEDGTLDPVAFRRYVAQDAFFLRAFFAAYALAAARTSDLMHVARQFHALMEGVLEELELHARYAATLGIDLETVTPAPAARGYTEFLLDKGWNAEVGEIVAAMTPCMRLYAWLGQELADAGSDDNPYHEWIRTYASPEFDQLAGILESLVDQLAAECPERADSVYKRALEWELRFFEAFLPSTAGSLGVPDRDGDDESYSAGGS